MTTGLVIDNFAGGGGASIGIERALGRPIDVAINHDHKAIAMHEANHPDTVHFCQSIMAIDPRDACTVDGKVAKSFLWWFSPDCKHHSKAKGGQPREKHIRDLAWIVVHWIERLGDNAADLIFLENVEEFADWGPLDENGYPIKDKKGTIFDMWVRQIRRHGYQVEWRELVAADYGTPTTRKRLYLIARRDGKPIVWPEPTHKPADVKDGVVTKWAKGRGLTLSDLQNMEDWRPAADCIDWDIECPSIFERKKALKANTHRRIAHGIVRYAMQREPFIVPVTNAKWNKDRVWTGEEPLRTVTTAKGGEYASVDAGLIPLTHQGQVDRGQSTRDPAPTITGANRGELARVDAVAVPMVDRQFGASKPSHPLDPVRTVTAGGGGKAGLADVVLVPHITKFRGGAIGSDMGNPMPTVTANGKPARPAGAQPLALAGVTLVQTGYGERKGQRPRVMDPQEPLGTVVASGGKHAPTVALLSQFRGSNKRGSGGDVGEPAKAITAGGMHQAVVTAHIEQANGGPRNKKLAGRTPDMPLSTVTITGSQQRLIETTLVEDDELPPLLLMRAARVAAFLSVFYLHDDKDELPGEEPAVIVDGKVAVITIMIDGTRYIMVDIGMRMLKPRELARAMGVPDDYILDPEVDVVYKNGREVRRPMTISEQISGIGNMVCPDMAEALVGANATRPDERRQAA